MVKSWDGMDGEIEGGEMQLTILSSRDEFVARKWWKRNGSALVGACRARPSDASSKAERRDRGKGPEGEGRTRGFQVSFEWADASLNLTARRGCN